MTHTLKEKNVEVVERLKCEHLEDASARMEHVEQKDCARREKIEAEDLNLVQHSLPPSPSSNSAHRHPVPLSR